MHDLLQVFKSLSDETRLRILGILLVRECCVCEVMQALQISQTRASRNLSALYNAGFLKQRKEGQWTLYSVDEAEIRKIAPGLLKVVVQALKDRPVVVLDRERLGRARRVGPGCVVQEVE